MEYFGLCHDCDKQDPQLLVLRCLSFVNVLVRESVRDPFRCKLDRVKHPDNQDDNQQKFNNRIFDQSFNGLH